MILAQILWWWYLVLLTVLSISLDETLGNMDMLRINMASRQKHKLTRKDVSTVQQPCDALDPNQPQIRECTKKGKFPVKDECRVFFTCENEGSTPDVTCCLDGNHFDHLSRNCLPLDEAYCLNLCEIEGTLYPDPNNFKQYLKCSSLGIPEEEKCPQGEHFDYFENKCLVLDNEQLFNSTVPDFAVDHIDFFNKFQGRDTVGIDEATVPSPVVRSDKASGGSRRKRISKRN